MGPQRFARSTSFDQTENSEAIFTALRNPSDIKNLIRSILRLEEDEVSVRKDALSNDSIAVPKDKTIRHLEWLLKSLVFWSEGNDLLNLDSTTGFIRRVQSAYMDQQEIELPISELSDRTMMSISSGINALMKNDLKTAQNEFRNAFSRIAARQNRISCCSILHVSKGN